VPGIRGQPPFDHVFVLTTESKAAAAVRISTQLALRKRAELLEGLRPCFARTEPWLQAGKYLRAVMSELPELNGWSIACHAGDRRPDKTQRLLNHASWDTFAAMGVVRRFAAAGLAEAARKGRHRRGHLVIGAVDETGQEKAGAAAGVKRQYLGCAGRVANGINTVHLAYVQEKTGHALIGARQWIPAEQVRDPAGSLAAGLPPGLAFRTKGQIATHWCWRTPGRCWPAAPGGTCEYLDADIRDPAAILDTAAGLLDFTQPVALMLMGIMGHFTDEEAYPIVTRLLAGLPAGSYFALYDGANTNEAFNQAQQGYNDSGAVPYHLRSPEQFERFFAGLELVEPGVVPVPHWRPDPGAEPVEIYSYCGVGRVTSGR